MLDNMLPSTWRVANIYFLQRVVSVRFDFIIHVAKLEQVDSDASRSAHHHVITSRGKDRDKCWNAPNIEISTCDYFSRLFGLQSICPRRSTTRKCVRIEMCDDTYWNIYLSHFIDYTSRRWSNRERNEKYELSHRDLFVLWATTISLIYFSNIRRSAFGIFRRF